MMESFLMNPFFSPNYGTRGPYGYSSYQQPRRMNQWPIGRPQSYYEDDLMDEDEPEPEPVYIGPNGLPLSQRDLIYLRKRALAQKEMERERERREKEILKHKEIERQKRQEELEKQEKIKKSLLKKKINEEQFRNNSKTSIPVKVQPSEDIEARKRKDDLNRRRAALVFMFNYAAKKIQRAFRVYRLRKNKEEEERKQKEYRNAEIKKDQSTRVLQRTFKRFLEIKRQQAIFQKIKILRQIREKVKSLNESYNSEIRTIPLFKPNGTIDKRYLEYEDTLVKTLIQLDGISSSGNEYVRLFRKSLISSVQNLLDEYDQAKQREKSIMQVD